jgi:hypothetical protein
MRKDQVKTKYPEAQVKKSQLENRTLNQRCPDNIKLLTMPGKQFGHEVLAIAKLWAMRSNGNHSQGLTGE